MTHTQSTCTCTYGALVTGVGESTTINLKKPNEQGAFQLFHMGVLQFDERVPEIVAQLRKTPSSIHAALRSP